MTKWSEKDLQTLRQRRGALRRADVSPKLRKALNQGVVETKTLSEMLVVDEALLAQAVLMELGLGSGKLPAALRRELRKVKVMGQLRLLADFFRTLAPPGSKPFRALSRHPSDTVRSWAAMMAERESTWSLPQAFTAMAAFADDRHMAVRETAWMALRPHVAKNPRKALPHLKRWARHKSANVRRCAIESCRPRGVWCLHLEELKQKPWLMESLLELTRADPSRYVQNSVANWLNDASKHQPRWVMQLTTRWLRESKNRETAYIVRRARRTLTR